MSHCDIFYLTISQCPIILNYMISCGMEFCLYNKDGNCLFDSIDINGAGQCAECVYTVLPPDVLNKYKIEAHRSYACDESDYFLKKFLKKR